MANIADIIELFILEKLYSADNIIVIKRNELAIELDCAPSQISYVLGTRFTLKKGFVVEARRGLGGFIKIEKLGISNQKNNKLKSEIYEYTSLDEIFQIYKNLYENDILTNRELQIIMFLFTQINEKLDTKQKVYIYKTLFNLINSLPKGGE